MGTSTDTGTGTGADTYWLTNTTATDTNADWPGGWPEGWESIWDQWQKQVEAEEEEAALRAELREWSWPGGVREERGQGNACIGLEAGGGSSFKNSTNAGGWVRCRGPPKGMPHGNSLLHL